MSPLWGGRFQGDTDALMARFNSSLPFDWRLWEVDIAGSIAWAGAICRAGLLTEEERLRIVAGLSALREQIAADPALAFAGPTDEDIHSYVERRLTEAIGPVAGKLHTGRSRNDQVATDTRLWLRDRVRVLDGELVALLRAAADRAEAELDVLMPGYTHLQPAQPVRWSQWLMSHAWAWERDRQRLADLAQRLDVMPLGSGALAGCPFAIDRDRLAEELGFGAISPNSMDAVSDRDFVAEFLFWGALLGIHLSRWSEDLIIWSSREYGFVTLDDAYSTGSSLMPQKKNPDALELLRGKSGRLVGAVSQLLVVLKGLPSAYAKDLQEDKEALFDACGTLELALPVARGALTTLAIHRERMQAALGDELLATDLADVLVREGVPFRESHHLVGRVVRRAEELGCGLRDVPLSDRLAISSLLDDKTLQVWDFERSVEQRSVAGGTARAAVGAQIRMLREALESYPAG
jgi:argininosuccinate lyase